MKDDKVFIGHILENIDLIERSVKDLRKSEFIRDKDVSDAVIRRIEVIGEAAKNISDGFKEEFSDIEWKKITGTRDVLIHAYFSVDLDLVWNIVKKYLPKLKKRLESFK